MTFDKRTGTPGNATQTIYVGVADMTGTCIYRTTDGGATWAAVPGSPPASCLITACWIRRMDSCTSPTATTEARTTARSGDVWKYNTATGGLDARSARSLLQTLTTITSATADSRLTGRIPTS